jgi:D-tyrosyl-tRNA(Tyr) deacylase
MRAVLTRVLSASVKVDGQIVGQIGRGFLVLLGVAPGDGPAQVEKVAKKVCGMRVFTDENDKMNLSLDDVGGELLVVSQFTLYGDCKKGNRPSFTGAAVPDIAIPLYESFLKTCADLGHTPQHGIFGAHMEVASVNDGPVTILLDTDQLM